MKKFIKNYIYLLCLLLVTTILVIRNFTPGTWLTGWDNLHPEFDFLLNIKRSIFAVWQEYQGLGLLGGMGHASDLPRQLFLWFISFLVPASFIRYFFHFLMLFTGTIGVYTLLKDFVLEDKKDPIRFKASFLGALFYLLNLGTAQYFFVPFEPYSMFWGIFPWELYTLFSYLKKPTKQNLILLAVINFLAIPQGYVQTVFLVYLICVVVILSISFIKNRSRYALWSFLKILTVIFCINAFWLLPNIYFYTKKLSVTQQAMNNKMNTEKFYQANKRRGTIGDFVLLREFYYDFLDYDKDTEQLNYMMKSWRDHFSSPLISTIGYCLFSLTLFGLWQKNKFRPYLLGIFGISAVVFLSDTPIISVLNDLIRSVPSISQIFRNPFTKFIVPAILVFSAGFAIGAARLLEIFVKKRKSIFTRVIFILIVILFFCYGYPSFKGELIYSRMRLTIPKEYFELFVYFKEQDKNARIMNLPQDGYWGWGSYRWGVVGSGFLWYGIEQPIMDRAFDVWSSELEDYYWQLMYTLKKRDVQLFNKLLEKYQISFIVFDPNYSPSDSASYKTLLSQETILENNPKLKLEKEFGSIKVYKTRLENLPNQNMSVFSDPALVTQSEVFTQKDEAFRKVGNYYSAQKDGQADFIFPFGSLFTNRFSEEHNFDIKDREDNFEFTAKIPPGRYVFEIPSLLATEPIIPVDIFVKREKESIILKFSTRQPTVFINNQEIIKETGLKEITIPQAKSSFVISINNRDFFSVEQALDDFKYVGSTYLVNSLLSNRIGIYSRENSINTVLENSGFYEVKECVESDQEDKFIHAQTEGSDLVLQARNTAVCNVYKDPIESVFSRSLYKVSFIYQSKTDEYPQYCLWRQGEARCLNNKDTNYRGFSDKETYFIDYFENERIQDRQEFINLILDPANNQNDNSIKEIKYKNIEITSYPLFTSFSLHPDELIKKVSTKKTLNLSQTSFLKVAIAKLDNSFSFSDLISKNHYKKNQYAYDQLRSGDFHLEEIDDRGKAVRLYAKDTYLNFWLDLVDWYTLSGSLLMVESRNLQGLPLLLNTSTLKENYKYLYTYISRKPAFYQNYFILPPTYEFDRGLKFIFNNNSVNRNASVNDLSSVSIYPVPYEFLTQISLKNTDLSSNKNHEVSTVKVKKHNVSFYEVDLKEDQEEILVLSQSFDPGWKAYEIIDDWLTDSWYMKLLIPFFQPEIKDHVLVNNWENGWKIGNQLSVVSSRQDDNKLITDNRKPTITIAIVYLPQYLEYFGFVLLGGLVLYFILSPLKISQ